MPRKKSASGRKYSKAVGQEVRKEMHAFKQGTAYSGKSHTPVKNKKQAVAIGLSEARKKGEKVPNKSSRASASKTHTKNSR